MRNRTLPILFLALAVLVVFGVSCSHPWNAAHSGLEVVAEAVVQTDHLVASAMPPSLERARTEVVAAAREARQAYEECTSAEPARADCGEAPDVETFLARYDELVSRWSGIGSALDVIRELLITMEAAVTTWRNLKQQPSNWGTLCQQIGVAQAAIVSAIEACGVTVPATWQAALAALEPVCTFIAPQPTTTEKGE
jgi:hypothetical protein